MSNQSKSMHHTLHAINNNLQVMSLLFYAHAHFVCVNQTLVFVME